VSAPTQLLADVVGYSRSGDPTTAGAYGSVTPARLLDTRDSGGPVAAGGTASVSVAGRGGVPASGVTAVALNVTAVSPTTSGFVTAYAGGTSRPATSNINVAAKQVVANLVIVPVGANGTVTLYASASTNLVADVAGYYTQGPS
jgi:hypothetical protein